MKINMVVQKLNYWCGWTVGLVYMVLDVVKIYFEVF